MFPSLGEVGGADDFAAYMETPERAAGSLFETQLAKWGAGETRVFGDTPISCENTVLTAICVNTA